MKLARPIVIQDLFVVPPERLASKSVTEPKSLTVYPSMTNWHSSIRYQNLVLVVFAMHADDWIFEQPRRIASFVQVLEIGKVLSKDSRESLTANIAFS